MVADKWDLNHDEHNSMLSFTSAEQRETELTRCKLHNKLWHTNGAADPKKLRCAGPGSTKANMANQGALVMGCTLFMTCGQRHNCSVPDLSFVTGKTQLMDFLKESTPKYTQHVAITFTTEGGSCSTV